jgi:transposase
MTGQGGKTAGISTSRPLFELAIDGVAERWHAGDDRDGWRAFASVLTRHGISRVGLDYAGHQPKLAHALRASGFTVVRIEPSHLRAYAWLTEGPDGAGGADAPRIAALTQLIAAGEAAPDPRFAALSGHLTYLGYAEEDLKTARARLAAHLGSAASAPDQDDGDRLGRIYEREALWAEERAARARAELVAELKGHPDIAALFDQLLAMPGTDEHTALALAVTMPELLRL